jgi:hypothetical protein
MIEAWINAFTTDDGSKDYEVEVTLGCTGDTALFTCGNGEAANKLLAAIHEHAEDADLN